VLFVVGLHRLFRVTPRMNHVRPRYVGVVRRLFVLSAFVVLCSFTMVTGSVGKMFLYLLVVFGSFFRHLSFSPGVEVVCSHNQKATDPQRLNQLSVKYTVRCYRFHVGAETLSRQSTTVR
jgi:hypothetical protein